MESDFAVCFTIYTVTRDSNHREIDNNKGQHLQHRIINDGDLILPMIRNWLLKIDWNLINDQLYSWIKFIDILW